MVVFECIKFLILSFKCGAVRVSWGGGVIATTRAGLSGVSPATISPPTTISHDFNGQVS